MPRAAGGWVLEPLGLAAAAGRSTAAPWAAWAACTAYPGALLGGSIAAELACAHSLAFPGPANQIVLHIVLLFLLELCLLTRAICSGDVLGNLYPCRTSRAS